MNLASRYREAISHVAMLKKRARHAAAASSGNDVIADATAASGVSDVLNFRVWYMLFKM